MTRLPRILYAVPPLPHVHLEIAKAIQTLAAQDDEHFERGAPLAKVRSDRELIAEIVGDAWRILHKTGFNPDEPRVPAGNPDGGQWTAEGSGSSSAPAVSDAVLSDATPNNNWIPGAQYAANDPVGIGHNQGPPLEELSGFPLRPSSTNIRVAMEPGIDPATGQPFSGETPLDRLGGGESSSGGGGIGGRAGAVSPEAAETSAAGPPQIGSFVPPDNLTYGTTLFGNYAHEKIANLLARLYPEVTFKFNVLPGEQGIDVAVLRDPLGEVGYKFGEIKPLTASGESSFNRQLERWGVGPVQSITYDAAGNVYYGFH